MTPPSSLTNSPALGIQFENVSWVRGATQVFKNLSLHLPESRIGLIGDNGAGKSSLFRLISGLDQPQHGRIVIAQQDRRDLPLRERTVGMMFQNPDEQIIFPTVVEELALSWPSPGLSRHAAQQHVRDWLQQRGLGHWSERAVGSLSQGQRQYVCWLSLLVANNPIVLLDEPFASLDLPSQAVLQRDIDQLPQQVLVSTHVLNHIRHFERVIWLDQGQVRRDGAGQDVCAAYEHDVALRRASGKQAPDFNPA